ncbi:hypothetical protein ND748_23060, partial [Frankia sp. AiPs1]|uniref:KR domain-containing protein n=1 Tax=Frankia sp. AiPs1 TaxID=573493 RepID=UPI002044C2F0
PGLRGVASIDRLTVRGPLAGPVRVRAWRREDDTLTVVVDADGVTSDDDSPADGAGAAEPLLVAEGLRLRHPHEERLPAAAVELRAHEMRWQPVAGSQRVAALGAAAGGWLIHSVDEVVARRWHEQLALAGVPAFVLVPAGEAAAADDGFLTLDTESDDPFEPVAKEVARQGGTVAGLLLHSGGLGERAFAVVRGFLRACAEQRPALVVCSSAGSPMPHPGDGLAAALTRTVAWEHPALRCVSVELDGARAVPDAVDVLGRATQLAGSGRLSVRDGRWYEARLRERPLTDAKPRDHRLLRTGGTCLVIGSGPEVAAAADWLLARGTASVTRVENDADQVAAAIDEAGTNLRCAVYLPRPGPNRPVAGWEPALFARALERTTAVPRLLYAHAAALDLLILCAPVATLPGQAGSAVETAAAEYTQALARRGRDAGLATISVSGGPWQEGDGHPGAGAELAARGLHPAPIAAVLDAVVAALDDAAAHVAPARADWSRYHTAAARTVPYVPLLATAEAETKTVGFGQGNSDPG